MSLPNATLCALCALNAPKKFKSFPLFFLRSRSPKASVTMNRKKTQTNEVIDEDKRHLLAMLNRFWFYCIETTYTSDRKKSKKKILWWIKKHKTINFGCRMKDNEASERSGKKNGKSQAAKRKRKKNIRSFLYCAIFNVRLANKNV